MVIDCIAHRCKPVVTIISEHNKRDDIVSLWSASETQLEYVQPTTMSGIKHQLKMLGSALIGRRTKAPAVVYQKKKGFTEAELKDLRTAFDLLDRNQDGRVTANELQFMLHNLGIHVRDELIVDLITEASPSGNGIIDEAEFLQWVARIQALRDDSPNKSATNSPDEADDITQDLIAAFRVFDRDGNGYITRDELQTAMEVIQENVTENQVSEMLALADLDKDGQINYEEFARLLL